MTDHADLCADVAHHGWDRIGDNRGTAIGEFKRIVQGGPEARLTATVDRARADVVHTGGHAHRWGRKVLTSFLRSVSVEHVIASGNDAGIPGVLTGRRNFYFERHGVNGVNVVVGIALRQNLDTLASLHNVRVQDLRILDQRWAVVVNGCFCDVVSRAHVTGDASKSGAKGGRPDIGWQIRGVVGCRCGEVVRAGCGVERRYRGAVDDGGGRTVLEEELERSTVRVIQVSRVFHISLECNGVTSHVGGGALRIGHGQSGNADVHFRSHVGIRG